MVVRRTVVTAALAALLWAVAQSVALAGAARPAPAATEDSSLYIEADREAEKLLEAARVAARAGNWRQAAETYQRVADFAGKGGAQPLAPAPYDPAVRLPVQEVAALELARLPRPAIELYCEAQDASAKTLFQQAIAARDAALLATVARRYLASSWGDDALAALGTIAFERGDYVGALAAWDRLLDAHAAPSVPVACILARMWLCHKALGHSEAAAALASELAAKHGGQTIRIGGRDLRLADFLAQQVAPLASEPLADWPALGGDATNARHARGIQEIGEPAWAFDLPSARLPVGSRQAAEGAHHAAAGGRQSATHATVADNKVLVSDGANVCALDLETGEPAWLYPDAPESGPPPALDETIHSVASSDGRAFACLGHTVLAFDLTTGRLLWRRTLASPTAGRGADDAPPPRPAEPPPKTDANEPPPPAKGKRQKDGKPLGSKVAFLLSPPVVAGPRVFVGLTHLGEEARASLVALDAATGHELWRTFVCSRSIPAFLGLGAAGAPPAVAGGTAYYATNLGAVAAVDAATGAVRWVHRYGGFSSHLRRSVVERRERWAISPTIADRGLVFVAPQDCPSLLAIDAVRGTVAWVAPRDGGRYVAGVEGDRLLIVGTQAYALDRLTGKRLWTTPLPSPALDRPALAQGRLYVPTADALLAVATMDGSVTTARLWQPREAPGQVTAVATALLVAAQDRLWAFGDWTETAKALAARLKDAPGDPSVPLAIGEHAAHRGAHAAAVAPLEQALRLATAANDPPARQRAQRALYKTYRALGEHGDEAALRKALAIAPDAQEKALTSIAIARLHERSGRYPEALRAYQALLDAQGDPRVRLEGGLSVSARALGAAEIARMVRAHGRDAYAAVEAEAVRELAGAKTAADLEAVACRFPNSAAAEQALLRLASSPEGAAIASRLIALSRALPLPAASEARAAAEAKLLELVLRNPPSPRDFDNLSLRWQVHTRIAQSRVQVVELPGAPPGRIYLATARRAFDRSMPFDGLECRGAEAGQLLWQRELGDWDCTALVAGGCLIVASFDKLFALDPLSGAQLWAASASKGAQDPDAGALHPGPLPPAGGLAEDGPEDRPRPGLDGFAARRRAERHRIVALAAGNHAVFAGLSGGRVCAFSLADGKALWGRQLDTRVLLSRGLFCCNGRLWACSESPAAVSPLGEQDGALGTPIAFRRDEAAFRLPRVSDRPAFVPAAARLYLVLDDHTLHALDLREGAHLWEAYFDFSIKSVLASDDGRYCYVLPDTFVHDAQIVSVAPATGKVARRRSLLAGALTDALLAPDALYIAERDNDNARVVSALAPADLSERWRTTPLQVTHAAGLVHGGGLLAVSGRHAGQRTVILVDAAGGRVVADFQPKGATELSAALVGPPALPAGQGLVVLATDRGIFAYGQRQREALEGRLASLGARVQAGDRSALPDLAAALRERGEERRAIALVASALADEALPAADDATLRDLLASLTESLISRERPELEAAYMPTPPHISGAIDEPWPAESTVRLDGPQHVHYIQGIPAQEAPGARWRSPSDLGAVLYTGWDSRHFYFAVDVTDDVHRTYTSQTETWIGDGLIISADCDDDGGYGYRFTTRDLLLTLALTRKDERRDEEDGDEPTGEYRVRLKEDNSGAVYEVAIPWDYMGIEDPRPGLRFGFNVTVTDDDGDRAVKAVSWTPGMILDRDRALMVRGFTPALFGQVVLGGPRGGAAPLWTPPPPKRPEPVRVRRITPMKEN